MIDVQDDAGIRTLYLAHGKANAMDLELVQSIERAAAEAAVSDAKAIVITGAGSIFCAGVDLLRLVGSESAPKPEAEAREYAGRFVPALVQMFLELFTLPKPLVVAVNGHAIAGGCILTLTGDYRIMARGGKIGIPEMLVGVPFPPAVIEIIRYAVSPQHLQTLMYSGRSVDADEAVRMGLVDEAVNPDALQQRAMEMARHFASLAPANFLLSKRQLRDAAVSRARHYGNELDDDIRDLWSDPERHAAIRAYIARTLRR